MLLRRDASFDLAVRLREGAATIGETYAFVSGLYFRGKLAYARSFAVPHLGLPPALVIVPGRGFAHPEETVSCEDLRAISGVEIAVSNEAYRNPLLREAEQLATNSSPDCRFVLLGSVATNKYTEPLLGVFGERLLFPADFLGRGDMSRGGLMLRRVENGEELSYIPIQGSVLRGNRPGKLEPRSRPFDPPGSP